VPKARGRPQAEMAISGTIRKDSGAAHPARRLGGAMATVVGAEDEATAGAVAGDGVARAVEGNERTTLTRRKGSGRRKRKRRSQR